MAEQTSKTVIGGFVVGALVLAVIGVLIFGSGELMKKTNKYILYFEESVKGLSVGSSVAFRGVKVGSVTDVTLQIDPKDMTSHIPVIIEVEPERIEVVGGVRVGDPSGNVKKLVERGLRAQLTSESLVTGRLMIEFSYRPDTPARLVGTDPKYPEIPTIPSDLGEMAKKIMDLPIDALFAKLVKAVDTINSVVLSSEIPETIETLKKFINDLDSQVAPLTATVKETLEDYKLLARNADKNIDPLVSDVRTAVRDYGKLARDIDKYVDPLGKDIVEAVKSSTSALKQAEETIKGIEGMVSEKSTTGREIQSTLKELSAAARSIRVWADYLERHPEALIRGKGGYRR